MPLLMCLGVLFVRLCESSAVVRETSVGDYVKEREGGSVLRNNRFIHDDRCCLGSSS